MWKTDQNGQITDELLAIIDWQVLMEGSPMFDLARSLATCTPKEIRNEAEKFIVDYYLENLTKEMTNGFTVPYTKKQLQDCYNYGLIHQAFGFLVSGLFFVEGLENSDKDKNEKIDAIAQRCRGLIEDADVLLSGDFKYLYEKYGQ
uniref:Uncharacterized protein n=1 Tax=Panagrolaimus sp. JU765 TaxID=591449 RepID=A0AC34PWW4_9BILA